MIVEIIAIFLLMLGGLGLLSAFGFSGWILLPLSLLGGISLYVSISYLQSLTGISSYPVITFGILLCISILCIYIGMTRSYRLSVNIIIVAILLTAGLFALIIILREINLVVATHPDSLRYLTVGSLIESNNLDWLTAMLVRMRYSSVAILHAPANISGEFYLRTLHPLVGI